MEEFLVIAACLLLNALLAAYEMAFVSVAKADLRRLARQGHKEAQKILALRENPERTLSILQIGITLVGAISAGVAGAGASDTLAPVLARMFGLNELSAEALAIVLVVLPITYLSVVIGELVPKTLAIRNPLRITLLGARWLLYADRALSPVVTALEWSTQKLVKVFFPQSRSNPPSSEMTLEIDSLAKHHQQAVLNLAHIERKQIRDILVPWKNVNHVRSNFSMDEVVAVVFSSGHTRLPVIDASDGQERVIGVLHTKEFLALRETGAKEWLPIVRTVLQVLSTDTGLSTLRLMQTKRSHMAVVYSPLAGRLGIVTMEDISEEIWGDIYDEDDDGRVRKVFAERAKSKQLFKQKEL